MATGPQVEQDAVLTVPPPQGLSREAWSDEQLLVAHRDGDRLAFTQIVIRYKGELHGFLLRLLSDEPSAEDLCQDTFLRVHQAAGRFDQLRVFRPWLFRIATNGARDLLRQRVSRPTRSLNGPARPGDVGGAEFIDLMPAPNVEPSEAVETEELRLRVGDIMGKMPEHLREILNLNYFHKFSYQEVSDILGVPMGTVKSRLHAAVAHFGQRWRAGESR